MVYNLMIGRDDADRELFGTKGLVFLGRSYVKMGQTTSLANNVFLDVNRSHVILCTGKRGSGKSTTLGVLAEEIINMPPEVKQNVAVVIFDTMGIFWTMKFPNTRDEKLLKSWGMKPEAFDVDIFTPKGYYAEYKEKGIPTKYPFALKTSDVSAGDWASIFEVKLTEPIGVLIEKTLALLRGRDYSILDIIDLVNHEEIESHVKTATVNRFIAAESWGLFDEQGNTIDDLVKAGRTTIIDVSCYANVSGSWGIKNLVIGYVCSKLINSRITTRKIEERQAIEFEGKVFSDSDKKELPLTWVLIDECHEALPKTGKTPATDALVQLLREGRQPGISLVLATQQPGEIHKGVLTQTDIIISHKLTAQVDIEALNSMMQSYLLDDIQKYLNDLPETKGAAIVLDDNSERIYPVQIHPKKSWHGGSTPSAIKLKEDLFKLEL